MTVAFHGREVDVGDDPSGGVPNTAWDTEETCWSAAAPVEHRLLVGAVADYFWGRVKI